MRCAERAREIADAVIAKCEREKERKKITREPNETQPPPPHEFLCSRENERAYEIERI